MFIAKDENICVRPPGGVVGDRNCSQNTVDIWPYGP